MFPLWGTTYAAPIPAFTFGTAPPLASLSQLHSSWISAWQQTDGKVRCLLCCATEDLPTRPPGSVRSHRLSLPQDNWVWNKVWSIIGGLGSYALLGFSVLAASLSLASVAVIVLLYTARVFTPIEAHLVRPLFFDFTQPEAVATVNLLNAEPHTHYVHDLHEFRSKVTHRCTLHLVLCRCNVVTACQLAHIPRWLEGCLHARLSLQLHQGSSMCAHVASVRGAGRAATIRRAVCGAG